MSVLENVLFGALIFTNWSWWIFFSAYHREIKKQLKERGFDDQP